MPYPDESNLTQLTTLKTWIDDPDANADTPLQSLITRASRFICRYVSRDVIFSKSVSEVRDGNGQYCMFMNLRPVTAVSLVQIDQTVVPASVSQAWGYVFNQRQVSLIGYRFYWGSSNVRIDYTGGIASGDPDQIILEEACLELIATVWKQRGREEVANRVMNGVGTETFELRDLPDRVVTMLSNVKNVVPPW